MTFSLVARCAGTGELGMVISSSSPAVAARCVFARAGVGAVASQNVTDPRLGPLALDLMAGGLSAPAAIAEIVRSSPAIAYRQILAVDTRGETAVHSGENALGIWSHAQGRDCAAGGNLLAHDGVPGAMVAAFETGTGSLGTRLVSALRAGLAAGGEAGPVRSAGLMVVDTVSWPVVDLRSDWDETCPVAALERAWRVYEPQIADYVRRALDPGTAPSYGVPGDA